MLHVGFHVPAVTRIFPLKVKMTRLAMPTKNVGTGTAKPSEQPFSRKNPVWVILSNSSSIF